MLGVFFVNTYLKHRDYTLAQAIPAGCSWAWESVTGYLRDLRLVATPSTGAYKSVGSFVAIGQVFPSSWNWHQFLYILALLSIMLGVMNLLPIPALDGGHIVFCIYELFTRRKPSDKFLMAAQMVGMVLLLLLMFVAFGNDIMRLLR
jgi:regulator of sigma E protease